MKENTVHVGFGFHVNCYHSYRGDTLDALGFGSDIRIIRSIIATLDKWNQKNVPVKATWDFENAYSLEEILPKHAPDIIHDVRRRCMNHGDENILMGYNNGAMSAMTEDEFLASIHLAITNEKGSGLQDLFGSCQRIIRPQEVMFTPSHAGLYKKAGISAVCLYYSCVSFDAFRTLIPQLEDTYAFNPLSYSYKGDTITIMPTYSHSDIMDAGSLRWLVTDLHAKQIKEEINHDVFVFINMDADSFLWEPFPVPSFLQKQPNFGGLHGLIEELQNLDFIRFNTVGGYLETHPALKTISFGQDVADGNFSGYSSWAEKPFNRQIWTRLERARAMARVQGTDKDSPSFDNRVRLLSTTHFGLASPVLNITRETKALQISEEMLVQEREALTSHADLPATNTSEDYILLKRAQESRLFCTQLSVKQGFCPDIQLLKIEGDLLENYSAHATEFHPDGSVAALYLVCTVSVPVTECTLKFTIADHNTVSSFTDAVSLIPTTSTEGLSLSAGGLTVRVHPDSGFPVLSHEDEELALTESFITYRSHHYSFEKPHCSFLPVAGQGCALQFSGEIHLPDEQESGSYHITFFTNASAELLFVHTATHYPYTRETDAISSQASNLGRFTDKAWQEVAPFALCMKLNPEATIEKRNFMNDISSYALSDFRNAFPENQSLDSFNHQLTGGILCAYDNTKGIAVAHDRSVLGSMAHCPMRLRPFGNGHSLSLNPFGTYFGNQRRYPTRGNGCVAPIYEVTMPQAQSLAPAYNGAFEQSIQAFHFVNTTLSPALQDILECVADSAVAVGGTNVTYYSSDNAIPHTATKVTEDTKKLKAVTASGHSSAKLLRIAVRFLRNAAAAKKKCKKNHS